MGQTGFADAEAASIKILPGRGGCSGMEMLQRLRMAFTNGGWPSPVEGDHHHRFPLGRGPATAGAPRTRHAHTRCRVPLPGQTLFGFLLSRLVAPWL